MKNILPAFIGLASLVPPTLAAETPSAEKAPPELRPRLYDLAGVLGNAGFKFRDGAWTGSLQDGKPRKLAVNLFAGNQYWFCGATSAPGETPSISLRDPSGRSVETVRFQRDGTAAVGVTAAATGLYTLDIGGPSPGTRDFCLLYLFK